MAPQASSGMGGGRGVAKQRRGGGVRASKRLKRGSSVARGGMNGAKRREWGK